jgi:hypothetical protein
MKLASCVLAAAWLAATCVQAQPAAPTPEMQAAREAMRKACETDSNTLCAGKQGREMMMCLRGNADKLSAGCKDAMAKMPRPPAPAQ